MKLTTLEELSNRLPVPDKLGKRGEFKFRTWRMPEEKKIGELKKQHKGLGRFVREVFDFMLVDFEGRKWETTDVNDRKLILSQLPWANVFYMWMFLRVDALGNQMKMQKMPCPACEFDIKDYVADLNSLEVKVTGMNDEGQDETEIKREAVYNLKKPILIGEVTVTKIKYGFTPWIAMEKLPAQERNFGTIKEAMLGQSIIGCYSEESGDNMIQIEKGKIMNSISKVDIEGLYDQIDDFNGGPVLALDVECPNCTHKFGQPLNWTYDYFFMNSSL